MGYLYSYIIYKFSYCSKKLKPNDILKVRKCFSFPSFDFKSALVNVTKVFKISSYSVEIKITKESGMDIFLK